MTLKVASSIFTNIGVKEIIRNVVPQQCKCAESLFNPEVTCTLRQNHQCTCTMGPEGTEICLSIDHHCSCSIVAPDACRIKDQSEHDCCCQEWGRRSCLSLNH